MLYKPSTVSGRCVDLEAMLGTELEVKFGCMQTVMNMLINQFRLFQDPNKRRSPQSVMETNNNRIYLVIKKLQEM